MQHQQTLRDLLSADSPVLCVELSPPLLHADEVNKKDKDKDKEIYNKCSVCTARGPCVCLYKDILLNNLHAIKQRQTAHAVLLNSAFYEQYGPNGIKASLYKP